MNKYENGKIYKIVCNITNEIYIGSTIQTLNRRLRRHKNKKDCVSRNIINRGDYEIILIKDYRCNNMWELEEEERKYILENECINYQIPHRTKKEYEKEWREKNKERIKENNKKRAEKIECECGSVVSKRHIARHLKTQKHLECMECKTSNQ